MYLMQQLVVLKFTVFYNQITTDPKAGMYDALLPWLGKCVYISTLLYFQYHKDCTIELR